MKERPILFSTEMVQAILDGRKTETRRVINPQPEDKVREAIPDWDGELHQIHGITANGEKRFGFCTSPTLKAGEYYGSMKSKYGEPGDLLYVRETFVQVNIDPEFEERIIEFAYKASIEEAEKKYGDIKNPRGDRFIDSWRWKPSIHMPKKASRIWLRVKEIKVERVQDISEADAIAEGIAVDECNHVIRDGMVVPKDEINWGGAIPAFANLWNSINEKRGFGWDTNPFVWVVKFEVVSTEGVK